MMKSLEEFIRENHEQLMRDFCNRRNNEFLMFCTENYYDYCVKEGDL